MRMNRPVKQVEEDASLDKGMRNERKWMRERRTGRVGACTLPEDQREDHMPEVVNSTGARKGEQINAMPETRGSRAARGHGRGCKDTCNAL